MELMGYCGIDCAACKNFKQNLNCQGCRDESEMLADCPTRPCASSRGHTHCGECGGFPCAQIDEFYKSSPMREKGRQTLCKLRESEV